MADTAQGVAGSEPRAFALKEKFLRVVAVTA